MEETLGRWRILAGHCGAALSWGALMAVSAAVALITTRGWPTVDLAAICSVYFAGGVLGYVPAAVVLRWTRPRLSGPVQWCVAFILLGGATLAATAAVLALEYREYYAQWHAPVLTRIWIWQQIYTAAGSTYQYAVLGTRLYWPLGVIFLAAASWWLGRKAS